MGGNLARVIKVNLENGRASILKLPLTFDLKDRQGQKMAEIPLVLLPGLDGSGIFFRPLLAHLPPEIRPHRSDIFSRSTAELPRAASICT